MYVDDIIVTRNNIEKRVRIKKMMAKEFEVKELGILRYFLGMGSQGVRKVFLFLKENTL